MAEKEKMLSVSEATREFGGGGLKRFGGIGIGEFQPRLRGLRAIKTYREMKDNDAIIGAFLTAMDMVLRGVEWRAEAADTTPAAQEKKEFVDSLWDDMSHTFDDFITNALTFLPFGFSFFEVVYKRREGLQDDPTRRSRHSDGLIGIRKLASRPQYTLERFEVADDGGIEAFIQATPKRARIPIEKGLLFRTTVQDNNPMGRSVLRNAYRSYWNVTNFQNIEAIAVERELAGLPVGRIPTEYLSSEATSDQKAVKNAFEKILRDVKFNEQGYVLLPSDPITDADGKPLNMRKIDIELMSASGTRSIDVGAVITRYQQDIARTVLADFILLGQAERGSFALSKSKTDLFLSSLKGYLKAISDVINRHLLPKVWQLNGFDFDLMPKMIPGDPAPVDLAELGQFIQQVGGAGASLFPDEALDDALLQMAGLPEKERDTDLLGRPSRTVNDPLNPSGAENVGAQGADRVVAQEGLNGAQIRSVLEVVAQFRAGDITRNAAIELMSAVGMARSSAENVLDQ